MTSRCGNIATAVDQPSKIAKASSISASVASVGKRKIIQSDDGDCHQKRRRKSENGEQYPQILLAIRLEKDDFDIQAWKECFPCQLPSEAQGIKIEGIYGSFSTLLLLRIPVVIWDLLPRNSAYSFVGFVTSKNLAIEKPWKPALFVNHLGGVGLETRSPHPQDPISRQSGSSTRPLEPDLLEDSQSEVPSRYDEIKAKNVLWSPLKSDNIQRDVEESGLKQLNKAPKAKVPDTFLRREAGLDELLDMSFDIMDQGSRKKIALSTSQMIYLTPVRILTLKSMLNVTLTRTSSSLMKDPAQRIDPNQPTLTREPGLK
jgi:hypothetical protein